MSKYKLINQLSNLGKNHVRELMWFKSFKGLTIQYKDIRNRNLANTPKGIYIPENKNYCLASKKTLGAEYSDKDLKEPFHDSSGGWYYEYSPEKNDQGMDYYTNKGLLYCENHDIPIGFLFQTHDKKNNPYKISAYKVLGLAMVRYDACNNIFKFYGFNDDEVVFIPN